MKEISRRRLFQGAALASALPLVNSFAGRAAAQGRRLPAGGRGPVQVLLVTKGHAFNRAPFFEMFDALGETITWTHVEHPAAQVFFDPKYAEPYDAFVYYDMAGRGGRNPDGSPNDIVPSDEMKKNFAALLRQGKGMVFFHHALASWVHTWPEYIEVMGGACDWGRTIENVRGKAFPFSGYRGGMEEHVTVVDKNHPVTQGLGDGFDIVDETYLCPMFEDSVHPLLRTDFQPSTETFPAQMKRDPNWNHPPGSNMTAWYKAAENSPIVYIQHGHDERAWENESFRKLMGNAISWVASKEGLDWAKKNPSKIFK